MLPAWIESHLPAGARHRDVTVPRLERDGFTPARGGDERMHVAEWGPADGTPVLLVHGNPTWGFLWRKVIAELRARPGGDRLRLVVPDLIGLGQSTKPRGAAHSIEAHSRWLGTLIDELIPGPLVVAAQDWGAPISLHAMSSRRARLRGLVLGNTALSPPREGFKPTLFHRLSQLPLLSDALFRYAGFPLRALHLSQGDRGSIRGDVARAYRWPLAKRADREAPLALARMVPDSLHHPSVPALEVTDELFRTIQVPISIVWGNKDPVLGRVINHLARLRPDATVVRTEAGHFLQEEVPGPLADAITEIVARADWS